MRILYASSLLVAVALTIALFPQDEAVVNAVAAVLRAEDSRSFDTALRDAIRHPDPIVRRRAALAIGRIGDPVGTPLLLELLNDPSVSVQRDAVFALGLLGDPSAFDRLRALVVQAAPGEQGVLQAEAVTAIAMIGGRDAAVFLDEVLVSGSGQVTGAGEPPVAVVQALREAWRLAGTVPMASLVQYGVSTAEAVRVAAVYSLSRLRAPEAADVFLRAVEDSTPYIRSLAARVLTAGYADSAGLDRTGVARWVTSLVEDPDRQVRVNSIRTLATYGDPGYAPSVVGAFSDPDPNIRIQALTTLGQLGGAEAVRILEQQVRTGLTEQRRVALLGLAQAARDRALPYCAAWILDSNWMRRASGADALGLVGGDTAAAWLEDLIQDPDGRVVQRALAALVDLDSAYAQELVRQLSAHSDPVVRTMAVNHMMMDPRPSDVALLVESYALAIEDDISDARMAVVTALGVLAESGFSVRLAIEDQFLRRYPLSDDYLVRRVAVERFPSAAATWGLVTPIETGRNIDDYRDIARRLVLPGELEGKSPGLVIETERGRIDVTLFAAEAPLTVDALLRLADQHYFDGGTWHRVVANFVVQDGDPRGDGWGGPGFSLRDEISRRRYGRGTVGMALSGPDTGGSQFFVTLSPQPHLDGTYPVVGQVDGGMDAVDRITQGDRIRTVRRR